MNFYVHHGYGKAQKINSVIEGGHVGGIILSPGDEDAGSLADTARYCAGQGLQLLIDPQTYFYSTRPTGRGRNHEAHGLVLTDLSWAQDALSVSSHIQAIGALNQALNRDGLWIAPGPLQDAFTDVWTPLSIQFARTSSQSWGRERTLATLAVDEAGLSDWPAIERWLDVATGLPVAGFYIVISRAATTYPSAPWAPVRLANLLRLIYVLGVVNQFKVVWAMSDVEGLLGLAAGATEISSGWSYTLRQFSASKWLNPASGGRAPTVRTHVPRLWSLPRAEAETASLFNSPLQAEIFTSAEIDFYNATPFDSISRAEAQVMHLRTLASRSDDVAGVGGAVERVESVEDSLTRASSLWSQIAATGLLQDPAYKNRIQGYIDSVRMFRDWVAL
jgi:hypothetical protein